MQPQVLATAIAASLLAAIAMPDASSGIARAQTPEKITVRFTWKLKGEYAPLFVALEKGYYSAEGLDVQLSEGNGAQNVLKALAAGNEKFGYGPAVAAARAVSQGLPIKVGALYQTMYLVGTAMGLAPCGLGGGHSDLFTQAAGTNYLEETSVGEFILGSRATTPFKPA